MHLTILGCRAGMPANGQPSSGYLVATATTMVLLDCGPGVAAALSSVTTADHLDGVIVSHLHVDHCFDLLPVGKTVLSGKTRYPQPEAVPQSWVDVDAVPLHVPAGAFSTLTRLAGLFPVRTAPVLDRVFDLAFDVREYTPGATFAIGDLNISLHELRHSAPNCGVRIESSTGSLAYTGDTGLTPGLLSLAADVDLLLAECTLSATDHGPHGHLSAIDAAQAAQTARAGSLVLTHFPSADPAWLQARREEAAGAFTGPVYLAQPGKTFQARPAPTAIHRSRELS
jgi:ribonuclease BN (tRNA processing enzyme)